jgi:hypothetical protein
MASEMLLTETKGKKTTTFDVEVETITGTPLIVFQGVAAQTKAEAINKVRQKLTFTAERCK